MKSKIGRLINTLTKTLVPPGLEPGTFRVLSERDNHYTTGLLDSADDFNKIKAALSNELTRNM
jgi:hypothetical protein